MSFDVWKPMLTSNRSLHNKSLSARYRVTHVELLQGLRCDMLWLWPVGTNSARYKEIFLSAKKRAKLKTKKYNYFRKIAISSSIPDALRNLHTSEYKIPRNKPADGYLWKLVKHNNVRLSKQLWFVARTEKFNKNQAYDSFSTGNYFRACFDRMGKLLKSTFPTL